MRTLPNFKEHLYHDSLKLYPELLYLEPISIAPSLLRPIPMTHRTGVQGNHFYTVFQYQVLLQWGASEIVGMNS